MDLLSILQSKKNKLKKNSLSFLKISQFFAAIVFTFYANMLFAQSPGGNTRPNLWLVANDVNANSGTNLTAWTDRTGINNFTVNGTPQIVSNGINFNQYIQFFNDSDIGLNNLNGLTGDMPITVVEIFAVYKYDQSLYQGTVLGASTGSPAIFFSLLGNSLSGPDIINTQSFSNPNITSKFSINCLNFGATLAEFYVNGGSLKVSQNAGSDFGSITLSNPVIGGSFSSWGKFNGKLSELIVYPRALSSSERKTVESYLAIKYGIHLTGNYISNNGTTIWNATANSTYHNDVFGIGNDLGSGLNQSQSNSINTGSGNGTGQNGAGNIVLSNASSLGNNDFMLIGHNNAALTFSVNELPLSMNNYIRTSREWYVDKTGDLGTVTLSFDMTGISGITVGGVASDYAILLDTDADFTSGATQVNASSLNGNIITFSGLTLADGQYITFAGKESSLPVTLKSFTSSLVGRNVNLVWVTAEEINNKGFEVQRKSDKEKNSEWQNIGFVASKSGGNSTLNYTFEDRNLNSGKYFYRLKQVDYNGNFEYFELSGGIEVEVPKKFNLSQNYPNPFNPVTKISFDLPEEGKVELKIYDMLGKEAATLVNGVKTAGYYTVNFNASNLSSGIYFYRLISGNYSAVKKMTLIK